MIPTAYLKELLKDPTAREIVIALRVIANWIERQELENNERED